MRYLLTLGALFMAPPAIAQGPEAYEQAVAARHAGDPGRAVELLEPLLRANPDNADAWVQLGYAQLALGRPSDAERSFERALTIAPSYTDARDGLALARKRRVATTARFRLDVDGAYTWVGHSQGDWREATVQLRADLQPGLAVTGRIEGASRFGRQDIYVEGRLDASRRQDAFGYLLVGGTPEADFRPKVQLGAGGGLKLIKGNNPTIATFDVRYARYSTGAVWTVNPGAEQYLFGGKAWLTARWINVVDEGRRSSGWFARADVQPSEGVRLFAGAADAPDTSEGRVIDTSSLFGGLAIELDERRSLRLTLARDKPDRGAIRTQLAIGMGMRF